MILDHLLCELLDLGVLRFLRSDLTQLNFGFALPQQTSGQEMVDRHIGVARVGAVRDGVEPGARAHPAHECARGHDDGVVHGAERVAVGIERFGEDADYEMVCGVLRS